MKVGQGILSCDLMDGKYNCSNPPKVNGKCFYKGKFCKKCWIYEVKCTRCDAIYIGKMQQTSKKIIDGHFSDVQHNIKTGKIRLISAYYEQRFKSTTSWNELHVCMLLKVI